MSNLKLVYCIKQNKHRRQYQSLIGVCKSHNEDKKINKIEVLEIN